MAYLVAVFGILLIAVSAINFGLWMICGLTLAAIPVTLLLGCVLVALSTALNKGRKLL